MLPSLLYYNGATARYKTLDECYKSYSPAKAEAYKVCLAYSSELQQIFEHEFDYPIVNAGVSAFSCMMFSFTSDIYVPLPVYSPVPTITNHQHCLVCRLYMTKDHITYSFSHEIYRMPDTVLLRLFDICPGDISYYYSHAQQRAMRQRAGELV